MLAFLCLALNTCAVSASDIKGITFFERHIRPLLIDQCLECHTPEKLKGGLRLDTLQGMLEGGDSGPAIRPYAGGISLVVIWPARGDHPGKFTPGELAAIRQWIDNGAIEN